MVQVFPHKLDVVIIMLWNDERYRGPRRGGGGGGGGKATAAAEVIGQIPLPPPHLQPAVSQ